MPIIKNIDLPFLKVDIKTAFFLIVFFVVFANFALWLASIIGKKIPIFFQFAKFGAVGAFNSFLDWGVLNLLMAMTGVKDGAGFSAFKGTSFIIASVSSYLWNKHWTFENKQEANSAELGKFATITAIGFLINIGAASSIVFFLSPHDVTTLDRLANLAAFSATIVSLLWNFLGYKFVVFKK